MADGDIIGPVGGLIGIGIMALAAKGVIDIVKEQKEKEEIERKKRKQPLYQEPRAYAPRIESQDRVQRGLDKMLGR
jgi:hypothetical protein